ncbi:hypothetical protein [Psychroserpens sp. SPM9]|uniref:hypothetical protein n=1 Tax=Psychroserpens sp. SPM9 TaxID=2975598 RepID=UPI0021A6212E|nr:hypothetical protein [Psychroserpens sp. SPM9]MDG5491594.1 hypothetical protein [Psychroserpens sp. SPM9]
MKLFNKIRFKMVEGKRFKNYLVYALGEIILVIIGILFALGINNWNQERQLRDDNRELQQKVLVQLEKDITAVSAFKENLEGLNQTYRKVLDLEYDKTQVNAGSLISTILFDVNTLSLDKHLINLIDNASLDESEASQKLIEINSMYKLYLKDIDDLEKIIYDKMTTNLAEIEKTQDWYAEFITDFVCRNDCISYLLKDKDHKARIASLRFLYISGYGNLIDNFQEDLQGTKSTLEGLIAD